MRPFRPFENALYNAKLALLILLLMLFVSMGLNIFLGVRLSNAPTEIQISQLNCDGSEKVLTLEEVDFGQVMRFARDQWVALNTWANAGAIDSPVVMNELIKAQNVTPKFVQQYRYIMQALDQARLTNSYILTTTGLSSEPMTHVKRVDDGWLVSLRFISRFYFNPYQSEKDFKNQVKQDDISMQRIDQSIIFKVVPYPSRAGLALDEVLKSDDITDSASGASKSTRETQNNRGV
ncbi:hypothetical protein [Cysteiniphilum marinum]|uniref:hypothetical protein n=1 Tax=Cysteiniphilum marinum TaxID=2774191 RepID=UPI001939FEED|nr:hypothetical protein [Cysteiniphilum marinum]